MGCSHSRSLPMAEETVLPLSWEDANARAQIVAIGRRIAVTYVRSSYGEFNRECETGRTSESNTHVEQEIAERTLQEGDFWPYASATQSKANKACCGQDCGVLNHQDCCEHSSASFFDYCSLCRLRLQAKIEEKVQNDKICARKLMEEAMKEACKPDTDQDLEEEDCPICLEPQQYSCALICGHSVCLEHVEKLKCCPLCRHPLMEARSTETIQEEVSSNEEESNRGENRSRTIAGISGPYEELYTRSI